MIAVPALCSVALSAGGLRTPSVVCHPFGVYFVCAFAGGLHPRLCSVALSGLRCNSRPLGEDRRGPPFYLKNLIMPFFFLSMWVSRMRVSRLMGVMS